jgi:hypothetical protein
MSLVIGAFEGVLRRLRGLLGELGANPLFLAFLPMFEVFLQTQRFAATAPPEITPAG